MGRQLTGFLVFALVLVGTLLLALSGTHPRVALAGAVLVVAGVVLGTVVAAT